MTEPPEFDPRAPLMGSYARKLERPKKPFREWIREPGSWIVIAIGAGLLFTIWACCFVVAAFLGNGLGFTNVSVLGVDIDSIAGTFVVSLLLMGLLLGLWTVIASGRFLVGGENGLLMRILDGLIRRSAPPLALDESPALLARKRGNGAEAARLYREWIKEFPQRLDLRFHLAETEHRDLGDSEAALRGYRDYLRRLRALDRAPTPREKEFEPLAEAYIADLERPPEPPPERRRIKI